MADISIAIEGGGVRSKTTRVRVEESQEHHPTIAADKVTGRGGRLLQMPARVAGAIAQRWADADPNSPANKAAAEREYATVRMAALRDRLQSMPPVRK